MNKLHHPVNRRWAITFEVVNACSWSAVLGAPLMLVLKSFGASAAILGIAVAMVPLTSSLQLAGAHLLPRFGYRGLMLRGWTIRTVFAGLSALVILASPHLNASTSIWAVLLLLTLFAIVRGITSCSWMPWIIQLIPEDERGRYIATASGLVQATLVVCGLLYAAIYRVLPGSAGLALVFGWGCLTGGFASWVLSRIPEAPVEAEGGAGGVPWKAMLSHRPFALFLGFTVLVNSAMAALGVLWVPLLRDLYRQSDSLIATVPVLASVTQLVMLPVLGPLVDRTGSRPLLFLSLLAWVVHTVLWACLAAGFLPLTWPVLVAIQGTAGAAGGSFGLASQRLLMGTVPAMGRSHFFALNSLAVAIGQGLMPILWGLALDALVSARSGLLNAHAQLYLAAGALLAGSMLVSLRLREPRALTTVDFLRELLVRTPRRALARWVNTGE